MKTRAWYYLKIYKKDTKSHFTQLPKSVSSFWQSSATVIPRFTSTTWLGVCSCVFGSFFTFICIKLKKKNAIIKKYNYICLKIWANLYKGQNQRFTQLCKVYFVNTRLCISIFPKEFCLNDQEKNCIHLHITIQILNETIVLQQLSYVYKIWYETWPSISNICKLKVTTKSFKNELSWTMMILQSSTFEDPWSV